MQTVNDANTITLSKSEYSATSNTNLLYQAPLAFIAKNF